ncbi:hypothetical protein QBC44DRAFT_370409 [Cladorrhinum sp. PSN332]|nr:hypothetical protein QBC44DRAFT_370409 [Cladorrhinum sp. PSN332]
MQPFAQLSVFAAAFLVAAANAQIPRPLCPFRTYRNATSAESSPSVSDCQGLLNKLDSTQIWDAADPFEQHEIDTFGDCVITIRVLTPNSGHGPNDGSQKNPVYFNGEDLREVIQASIDKFSKKDADGVAHVGSIGTMLCDDSHNETATVAFNLY